MTKMLVKSDTVLWFAFVKIVCYNAVDTGGCLYWGIRTPSERVPHDGMKLPILRLECAEYIE